MSVTNLGILEVLLRMRDELTPNIGVIQRTVDQMGTKMRAAGTALLPLSAGLAAVGFASVKMSTDFNAAMANVATLIPGNIDRVKQLKTAVRDMAVDLGKSTGDLTDGLFQVISAFGDTAGTVEVLDINARAAAAGLATTLDAINLTSAVTKGYGDTSAAAVQHVADLAFQTNKLGQTTFPELAGSMGRVVPLAAALKVKQEELFGVMAVATGVTGNASEVSTQLRGVLQSLLAPTEDMSDLLDQLGVSSGKALLEQRGLQGTINAVVAAAEATGIPLQKYLSSIEGQTLALALAGPQATTFTEKLAAMQQTVGLAEEAFREQTEGVNAAGHAWNQFKQEIVTTAQRFGDQLVPHLQSAAQAMKPMFELVKLAVDWFGRLPQPVQMVIVGLAALVVAAGPVLLIFGAMATSVSALIALWPVLVAGMSLILPFLGPVGLIAVGVGAVLLVFAKWDTIVDIAKRVFEGVKLWLVDRFVAIGEGIRKTVDEVIGFFTRMKDRIVGNSEVPELIDGIQGQFARLQEVMVAPSQAAAQAATEAFERMRQKTVEALRMMGGDMQTIILNTVDVIDQQMTARLPVAVLTPSINVARETTSVFDRLKTAVTGTNGNMFGGLIDLAGSFSPKFANAIQSGLNVASGIAKIFAGDFSGVVQTVMSGVALAKSAISGLRNLFRSEESRLVNRPRDEFFNRFGGSVQSLGEKLAPFVASGEQARQLIERVFQAKTKAQFEGASGAIERLLQGVVPGAAAGGLFTQPAFRVVAERQPEIVGSPNAIVDALVEAMRRTGFSGQGMAGDIYIAVDQGQARRLSREQFRQIQDGLATGLLRVRADAIVAR